MKGTKNQIKAAESIREAFLLWVDAQPIKKEIKVKIQEKALAANQAAQWIEKIHDFSFYGYEDVMKVSLPPEKRIPADSLSAKEFAKSLLKS